MRNQRVYVPGHAVYGLKLNDMTLEHLEFILEVMRHPSSLADNVTLVLTVEGMSDAAQMGFIVDEERKRTITNKMKSKKKNTHGARLLLEGSEETSDN